MLEFLDDDDAYLAWLAAHQEGFVVNARRRRRDPTYFVLHRATCRAISRDQAAGAYTSRGYSKICADDIAELRHAARAEGRVHGDFSTRCSFCKP